MHKFLVIAGVMILMFVFAQPVSAGRCANGNCSIRVVRATVGTTVRSIGRVARADIRQGRRPLRRVASGGYGLARRVANGARRLLGGNRR